MSVPTKIVPMNTRVFFIWCLLLAFKLLVTMLNFRRYHEVDRERDRRDEFKSESEPDSTSPA
jgi:hypothetical protein